MMRFVVCLSALIGLASATRAKDMKDESFAWPWDRDSHHAVPHHLGGLMAAHARVHHGNMFDSSSSSDFSLDSDSSESGGGGDFMDQYIKETGQKPLQMDDDKPKVQKQDDSPSIPDMASLFNDDSKAQPRSQPQQPWADQRSSSSNMDNLFGGSFGFDNSNKAFDNFDTPAKPARQVDSYSHTDDGMTNLFGGSSSDSAASSAVSSDAAAATSDSTSGWPWDMHAKKKEDEEAHHSRDLWAPSHSDSDSNSNSNSGSTASSDMDSLFGGSNSGSNSHSFSDWSSNDFGSNSGVSQPAKAPQQDDAPQRSADSPIEGPTQRESSISGATATDQVVDVRLSSELQQSLLQARNAETKMLQRFRGVSN